MATIFLVELMVPITNFFLHNEFVNHGKSDLSMSMSLHPAMTLMLFKATMMA